MSCSVVPIRALFTTIRPASKLVYCLVSYVHKTLSFVTVFVLI